MPENISDEKFREWRYHNEITLAVVEEIKDVKRALLTSDNVGQLIDASSAETTAINFSKFVGYLEGLDLLINAFSENRTGEVENEGD